MVGWGLECTGFWIIANALGGEASVPFLAAVLAYALGAVAGAVLIVFPGGLGMTEFSIGTLLRRKYFAAGIPLEIARAQALYEQRVPDAVRRSTDFFRAELVRTLAGGDATLLDDYTAR